VWSASSPRTSLRRTLWLLSWTATYLAVQPYAQAQILDDIEVRDGGALAEIRIGFTLPMRYQAHFPAEHGEMVRVSFQAIALDDPEIIRRIESKKSPPNNLIPAFTVSYNYQNSCYAVRDPVCLVIQFDKPVSFTIRQSEDDRSFYLYVPIIRTNPDTAPKTAPKKP
jgi:hypothetical protein